MLDMNFCWQLYEYSIPVFYTFSEIVMTCDQQHPLVQDLKMWEESTTTFYIKIEFYEFLIIHS